VGRTLGRKVAILAPNHDRFQRTRKRRRKSEASKSRLENLKGAQISQTRKQNCLRLERERWDLTIDSGISLLGFFKKNEGER